MVPISHMMVLTPHMMVFAIALLGILNFFLLFKFNIYKNQIVLTSHMMVLISHLMVPIECVPPYPQKEYGYHRMTL